MSSIITGAGLNSFRSQFTAGSTYALAEIIDNSIQWKRKNLDSNINIILIEKIQPNSTRSRLEQVAIVDNGVGMDKETISSCLNFGGGNNHGENVKGRLGKFGLGLPYASCSQSPNYEVISWENTDKIYSVSRNHKSYSPNDAVTPSKVVHLKKLPDIFTESLIPEIKNYKSGTIILWKDCDRLDVAQAKTLINHIDLNLGRIYRHFIGNGVEINYRVYKTRDYKRFSKIPELSKPIRIFDPLFLMTGTALPDSYSDIATNEPWLAAGDEGTKTINFKEIDNGKEVNHEIKITCTIAKSEIQGVGGVDGGKVEPGKTYYKKASGISLVRAKRELKLADFGFQYPNGNGDQRHRWWSIEVQFEPISDDLLGVNANKLDAKNFRYLSSDDFMELEQNGMIDSSTKLRHTLSREIDKIIKDMFKLIKNRKAGGRSLQKCPNCSQNTFKNGKCSACSYQVDYCPKHGGVPLVNGECTLCKKNPDLPMCIIHDMLIVDGVCPKCDKKIPELTEEERQELQRLIKVTYPELNNDEYIIEKVLNWYIKSNRKHFVVYTDLRTTTTFIQHHDFNEKFKIIEINTSHPFYEKFIQNLLNNDSNEEIVPLLLFIASWVETEVEDYSNSKLLERFRDRFGVKLSGLIDNWAV